MTRLAALLLLSITGLSACASGGYSAPAIRTVQMPAAAPDIREMPPEEMFALAIDEICFGALKTGVAPAARLADAGFIEAGPTRESFHVTAADRFYAAEFASSPVLVGIVPATERCDVIAVRGDHDLLKSAAEDVIAGFEDYNVPGIADHLAVLDRAPQKGYALKFTLLYGSAVDEQGQDQWPVN